MNNRDRRFAWIGIVAGSVGIIVLNVAPLDTLLPLNQVLFASVCALIVIWLLAFVTQGWGDD